MSIPIYRVSIQKRPDGMRYFKYFINGVKIAKKELDELTKFRFMYSKSMTAEDIKKVELIWYGKLIKKEIPHVIE